MLVFIWHKKLYFVVLCLHLPVLLLSFTFDFIADLLLCEPLLKDFNRLTPVKWENPKRVLLQTGENR